VSSVRSPGGWLWLPNSLLSLFGLPFQMSGGGPYSFHVKDLQRYLACGYSAAVLLRSAFFSTLLMYAAAIGE